MLDNFDSNAITSVNFEGFFDGTVLETFDDSNKSLIYVPKILASISEPEERTESSYLIETNNINNSEIRKEVKSLNGIICYPISENTTFIRPRKGDKVIVLFLNGDPQKPYYLTKKFNGSVKENDYLNSLKDKKEKYDVLSVIDDFLMVYNDTSKSFIIRNGEQELEITKDGIKLSNLKPDTYTSETRPVTDNYIGRCIFDLTLLKPIYFDGRKWRDAMGNIV